ncbi:MAG: hypothetical protein QOF53_2686 [Nocardioidaceae bacterium]|nr:hypothetical protein [Nocardioidaceae bacterium]
MGQSWAHVLAPQLATERRTVAGAVYGTVSVTALIAGSSHDEDSAGRLLLFAAAASLVVWAVHVYASVLYDTGPNGLPWRTALTVGVHRELGVLEGALLPLLILLLGAVGLLADRRAITWSMWSGVLVLFLLPLVWLRRDAHPWWSCIAGACVGGAFGVALTALKVLLH